MAASNEPTTGTQKNKVGVYDETKELLNKLKDRTGIPHARLVQDAVRLHAKRLMKRVPRMPQEPRQPAA